MTSGTESRPAYCPVCTKFALVKHCANAGCPWHKCRTPSCEAVLNVPKRHGHAKNPRGPGRIDLAWGAR